MTSLSIADLRQRRAQLDKEVEALLAADPGATDHARLKRMIAEKQSVGDDLAVAVARQEIERAAVTAALDGTPNRATAAPGRRWAALHRDHATDTGGFETFGAFLRAVADGRTDPRLVRANSGETDSGGGFAIPGAWSNELMSTVLENSVLFGRVRKTTMASRQVRYPLWNNLDHTSDTTFGGFTAAWLGETSTAAVQTPTLREIALDAKKLVILCRVSNELLDDGVGFEADLRTAMAAAAEHFLDLAILRGDGAGKPLGILNAPCLVTVPKETGQLANTLVAENVIRMFSRLTPGAARRAVWVANSTVIPELLQFGVTVGTGGAPLFIPSGGLPQAMPGTLLGAPIAFTEKASALGTVGDIVLVDPDAYLLGVRKDITIDLSRHPAFTSDESFFRLVVRLDGQPTWNTAMTPARGDTLSPFVALATRS